MVGNGIDIGITDIIACPLAIRSDLFLPYRLSKLINLSATIKLCGRYHN